MNELTPAPSLTKSELLKQEIDRIQDDISRAIDAESKAHNDQYWLKKRLKVAKDELNELSS